MATELKVKKIGNSLGFILPAEIVKSRGLKPEQKVFVEFVKKSDLRSLFGLLKTRETGQSFKDRVRRGWEQ